MNQFLLQIALAVLPIGAFAQADSTLAAPGRTESVDSAKTDSAKYWKQFNLGEVTVSAQRHLVKNDIDRLSYDVQHDEDSKTQNTLEILRKVPMVTVDGQENIKVKGSSDFKIYRNGHPDPSFSGSNISQILKAIPANMIKRIEVITDPGAKEDAEGTHYILNIVMNDDARMGGVTGTLSSAIDFLSGSTQPSAYVTTQAGKLILSANYGFVHATKSNTRTIQDNRTDFTESGQTQTSHVAGSNPVNVHYGNLNGSYDIDSLNLLTLAFGGYYYSVDIDYNGTDRMFGADNDLVYQYDTHLWMPKYNYYNVNGRADYEHKTKREGESLTASYMLSSTHSVDDRQAEFSNMTDMPVDYTGYNENKKENFVEHTFQIDYIRPFAKYHKMEFGAKYINRENKSNTSMLYHEAETTADVYSDFDHNTQIAAAYGEWIYDYKKWAARAGLRYEYSYLEARYPDGSGQNFHKNLNDWVPSASIKYTFNPATSLKLSYSTSINRPGISYLNPAVVSTPTQESYGNSGLNSSRNSSFNLEFMHIQQKFTWNISPFYSFSNDQISDVKFAQDGKTVSTYDDVLHTRFWGLDAYAQIMPFMGTQLMLNAHIEKRNMNNHSLGLSLDAWTGEATGTLSQQLPWKFRLSLGGGSSFGQDVSSVYGYDTNWYYHYALLQRSFLKEDRLTVMLGIVNPFGSSYTKYSTRTVQGNYRSLALSYQRQKQFGIRISYRFGSLKASVKQVDKTIENNDIIGGIGKGTVGQGTQQQGGKP